MIHISNVFVNFPISDVEGGCSLYMNNEQVKARDEAERQRVITMANDNELLGNKISITLNF